MAHNDMVSCIRDFLIGSDVLKIAFRLLAEFLGIVVAANQHLATVQAFQLCWP